MWTGTVADGGGNCSRHMAARDLDRDYAVLGYRPVPGSLNLRVHPDVFAQVEALPSVEAQGETFWPVRVGDVDCHAKRWRTQFELVAPVNLRDHLGLTNGDLVTVKVRPSISVVVMAHQKRAAWAEELAGALGCGIVWDERSNVWDTARRAWMAHDPSATHHLVVQDDALLSDGLLDVLPDIAAAAGLRPVSLCTIGYRIKRQRDSYDAADRWWPATYGVSSVALMLPVADLGPMLAHCDGGTSPHDDNRIVGWYRHHGRAIWCTKPSLVGHRPASANPTLIAMNGRSGDERVELNFGSGVGIDWTEGLPSGRQATASERVEVGPMATFENLRSGKTVQAAEGSRSFRALSRNRRLYRQVDDAPAEPEPAAEQTDDVDSYHTGAGWYELPDGRKVRGREAAEQALS